MVESACDAASLVEVLVWPSDVFVVEPDV